MLRINSFDRAFFGKPLVSTVRSKTVKASKNLTMDSVDDFNKHFWNLMSAFRVSRISENSSSVHLKSDSGADFLKAYFKN